MLGNTENFLGIRLVRDRDKRKLWILLDDFIKKTAERFNLSLNSKALFTSLLIDVDLQAY